MKKIAVLAMTFCFLFAASQVDAQTKKDNKQTTVSKKESKKSASDQTVANSTKTNPKLDSFKQRGKKENSDQTNAKTATTTKTASTTTKASTTTTTTATTITDKTAGKDAQGRTIYEGPKGGKYYLNKDGKKVYVKK